MGFNKIVAVSMTELFVQQIENMILSGELAIGRAAAAGAGAVGENGRQQNGHFRGACGA